MRFDDLRLLANLFGRPVALGISAFVAEHYINVLEGYPWAVQFEHLLGLGVVASWVVVVVWTSYGVWKLWPSLRGAGQPCHSCAAPTR